MRHHPKLVDERGRGYDWFDLPVYTSYEMGSTG